MTNVPLGQLVDIRGGGTPRRDIPAFWNGKIPWATVKDFKSTEISETLEAISELGVKESATSVIPAGNIIIPTRMALGKVAINRVDLAINQDLKALLIRDRKRVDGEYLFRFLLSKSAYIEGQGKGATVKGITVDVLRDIDVPLPPLSEQKRIAAILDKADAIRRKRQQAIKLADEFLRSVFLDMFGDLHLNPKRWDRVPLGEITAIDAPMVDPTASEYLDLPHVGPDRIEKETGKILPTLTARQEGLISGKFLFDDHHVLFTKIRPYLRKVALPNFRGLCSADMYPVSPDTKRITREYLWAVLISKAFVVYFEGLPDRASIPKLNRDELAAYRCMLPPIGLQEEYSRRFRMLKDLGQNNAGYATQAESCFGALAQRAFWGEL